MVSAPFRLLPRWPEQLVYEEDETRRIEFQCLSPDEPPQVVVPDAAHWRERVPPWAGAQRDAIVARLRAAGCVLAEIDGYVTRRSAPDQRFLLEEEVFPPDRDGGWETLRLWQLPSRERLLQLPGFHVFGAPHFQPGDMLRLGLQDHARQHTWQAQIDLTARTFVLQPNETPRPLSALGAELERVTTASLRAAPTSARGPLPVGNPARPRIGNAGLVLGSLLFVVAGLWLSVRAETLKDRALGIGCALFFAACACTPLLDRRGR